MLASLISRSGIEDAPLTQTAALQIIDSVTIVLSQAYPLARARVASAASPVLRLMAQRDHDHMECELQRRETEIMRGQRANLSPHKRPAYSPEQRLAIVQLMRLRGWNAKATAQRFVLHENTVRSWIKAADGRCEPKGLLAAVPWNKIDDAVRWAVHELRRLYPEPEFGTRSIAQHLVRSGGQISPRSAQRILREDKPARPKRPTLPVSPAMGVEPDRLLRPCERNEVWQMDLMELRWLWCRFTVAALLDG